MNRGDFQRLADERLSEANLLLAARKWAGAYYLAGYAVECALKACILARIEREGTIFEDKKFSEKCWTHSIETLLELSALKDEFSVWVKTNPFTEANSKVVCNWSETTRYEFTPQSEAEELIEAIEHPNHGVLQWIKQRW